MGRHAPEVSTATADTSRSMLLRDSPALPLAAMAGQKEVNCRTTTKEEEIPYLEPTMLIDRACSQLPIFFLPP